jgi:hypothetical protein
VSFAQSLAVLASELYEPRNWWGVVGLLIVNLGVIVTAVCTGIVLVRQRSVQKDTSEVKAQVVNGHKDPLRVDIDRYFEAVHERLDQQGERMDAQTDRLDQQGVAIETLAHRVETLAERRLGEDRRSANHPLHDGPDRRSGHERRK